jgi:hypothetical protein
MDESTLLNSFYFLEARDLLNAGVVNKSFNRIYKKYYYFFWKNILIYHKTIQFVICNEYYTLKYKKYAISYPSNIDSKKILFDFIKYLNNKRIKN